MNEPPKKSANKSGKKFIKKAGNILYVLLVLAIFGAMALMIVTKWDVVLSTFGKKTVAKTQDMPASDPAKTKRCKEYMVTINRALARYAKVQKKATDRYPWTDYGDMVDSAPPSLIPNYVTVLRICESGGQYIYEPWNHKVLCSLQEHNR